MGTPNERQETPHGASSMALYLGPQPGREMAPFGHGDRHLSSVIT